jgi:hypothetical protein
MIVVVFFQPFYYLRKFTKTIRILCFCLGATSLKALHRIAIRDVCNS